MSFNNHLIVFLLLSIQVCYSYLYALSDLVFCFVSSPVYFLNQYEMNNKKDSYSNKHILIQTMMMQSGMKERHKRASHYHKLQLPYCKL